MQQKNEGAILVIAVIIFSIVAIMAMTSIGMSYNNLNVYTLEYKAENMNQSCQGAMEIIKSNIIRECKQINETAKNEDEFYEYILGEEFKKKIKDLSKSELKNIRVSIPYKISKDKSNKYAFFEIMVTIKDGNYAKRLSTDVKVLNLFNNEMDGNSNNKIVEMDNYKEM